MFSICCFKRDISSNWFKEGVQLTNSSRYARQSVSNFNSFVLFLCLRNAYVIDSVLILHFTKSQVNDLSERLRVSLLAFCTLYLVGYQRVVYYSVNGKKQEGSSILIENIQNVSFLDLLCLIVSKFMFRSPPIITVCPI